MKYISRSVREACGFARGLCDRIVIIILSARILMEGCGSFTHPSPTPNNTLLSIREYLIDSVGVFLFIAVLCSHATFNRFFSEVVFEALYSYRQTDQCFWNKS